MALPILQPAALPPDLPDKEFRNRLKEFLHDTRLALREEQRLGICGGLAACRKYSDGIDTVLRALHDRARARFLSSSAGLSCRMAVVAVGGYGRRELCPKSDLDLLFLHHYKVDPYVEAMTESILYPLWDLGFEVGHSVRNVKETVRLGGQDDSIRTALMDHRLVAGDAAFFREAGRELEKFLYYADGDRFIETKIREMRSRHARMGATVYLLEPNIKDGRGGLRDIHSAVWAARVKYKVHELRELRQKGVVSAQNVEAIRHVLDYLLRVRNELHYVLGKKADVLTFEAQEQLAERFRYRKIGPSHGVERFMRTYYLHAASATQLAEDLLEEVGRYLPEEGARKSFFFFKRKSVGAGGILYKGKLQVSDPDSFEREPIRILEFFRSLQASRSSLSRQAKKSIQQSLPAIGPSFREDPEAARLFLSILSDPVHLRETLLAMNESRFLGRFIPEFEGLFCRVLRDVYHVYTADAHSIRCASVMAQLETAAERSKEEEEFLRIYRAVPNRALLTLAILFHDIGKGKGHGHSRIGAEIVSRIGNRWRLPEQDVADLVFLVEQHLLMAHISQRRDLHDIEMILSFADTVGSVSRLDQLYVLTYADMKEVGPDVWNQWKAMLLSELYEKGRNVLEQGVLKRPFEELANRRRGQVREWLGEFPAEEVERFVLNVDDRYILATPDSRFAEHFRLLSMFNGQAPIVETFDSPESGTTEFIVVAPDQRGLFAQIAGTLSANGVNILNASISTTRDGVAIDTFYVNSRGKSLQGDPKKDRVVTDLLRVLRGEVDVSALIADPKIGKFMRDKVPRYRPTRVVFDDSVSSRYTVVDIFTYDRIGLLYDITRTLTSLGADIILSKIATKADQVADSFYLVDRDGGKISDASRQEEIRQALLAAIGD
ncbi:MAG TPA: [protein-PII] uridylyltransferase [Candidatus Deferrimicrobiaceae bacterium]